MLIYKCIFKEISHFDIIFVADDIGSKLILIEYLIIGTFMFLSILILNVQKDNKLITVFRKCSSLIRRNEQYRLKITLQGIRNYILS